MRETVIYLARHGVTGANKDNIFAGRTDEPLHRDAGGQLAELAELIAGQGGVARIYCGPLARTRESAEKLAAQLPTGREVTVLVREGLNEIAIPHWDGLSKEEIRALFGPQYPTWLADPAGFAVEGCETIAAVQERAVRCLEEIFAECAGSSALVVSHLIVIRSLLLHYLGRPLADFREIKVSNAELVVLRRPVGSRTTVRMSCAAD